MRHALLISALFAASLAAARAGESVPTITDPAQAGPDFAIQGEYLSEGKLGIQVIAYGDGKFRAVALPGGLPGAGWTGKDASEVEGTGADGKASFGDLGTIAGDAFSAKVGGAAIEAKKVVRVSPTMGAKPPAGAVVLFDGSNVDNWDKTARIETIAGEKVLACGPKTARAYTSYQIHLEFRTPFKPKGQGQDRGNSGVYIHHTYEIQILDSFGLKPERNHAGALYTVVPPSVNMCLPPLSWQTYDIDFSGPQFDGGGKKTANARVTVKLNGVTVQDNLEIERGTGANKNKAETPAGGPLWLQDHQNPVVFRNIWLLEKK